MRLIRDIAFTAFAVAALFGVFEVGLRLAGIHYQASLYTPEGERGFALRPNSQGWETEETDNYIHINSAGMNDREHTLSRPPGTVRIAVVGSSEAEARQVPRDQTFEAVLERNLRKAGKNVEVLNFGVPGYALAQEYLTLKHHVWQYDPQIVVVAMSVFTILKNTRALYPGDPGGTPFFAYQNGRLVLNPESANAREPDPGRLRTHRIMGDLMNRSELLKLLNEAAIEFSRRLQQLKPAAKTPAAPDAPPMNYMQVWPYLNTRDPQTSADPRLLDAWRVGEDLLRMMRDDAEEHHAEFWLVTLDMVMQVHPEEQARAEFQRTNHLDTLFASDHRLDDFARAEHIHSFLLAPPLAQYALEHKASLHGKNHFGGHWNQLGHQVAGDLITAELLRDSVALNSQ